jgi:hypothetical protein
MDWAICQPRIRFDIRAEREECERLFNHQARVLQDRLVRRGLTDRTRQRAVPEWKKICQTKAQKRRLLYQARVLSWAKRRDTTMRTKIVCESLLGEVPRAKEGPNVLGPRNFLMCPYIRRSGFETQPAPTR